MQSCKEYSRMPHRSDKEILESSPLYIRLKKKECEINRHKYLESEKAHRDVGFSFALFDWILRHEREYQEKMKASGLYK